MKNKFEFELFEIPGTEVIPTLLKLRTEFPETGKYPFIIGNAEGFQLEDSFKLPSSDEILEKAESIDAAEWFAKEKEKFGEDEEEEVDDEFAEYMEHMDEHIETSKNSDITFEDQIQGHKNILSGSAYSKTNLGIAEINAPWMLPAFVKYGGWNACPMPEIHCAAMKYWQKKYGAEIVTMAPDVVECKVSKPPKNEEDAMSLAWEQYVYCPDIVDQGTITVSRLAETIIESNYWYFWWD